jgi:dethiobiotin synthetase
LYIESLDHNFENAMSDKHQGIFVTGSDTEIGKTTVSLSLLKFWKNYKILPFKPVESGYSSTLADSSRLYAELENSSVALEDVVAFRYPTALSPPLAARAHGQRLFLQDLLNAFWQRQQMFGDYSYLVEGAGGFCSPIAEDGLNADFVQNLQLPVLLVVPERLGAVHQALSTLESITQRGLRCLAIVLNQCQAVEAELIISLKNKQWIEKFSNDVPVFYSVYNQPESLEPLANYLSTFVTLGPQQ